MDKLSHEHWLDIEQGKATIALAAAQERDKPKSFAELEEMEVRNRVRRAFRSDYQSRARARRVRSRRRKVLAKRLRRR